MEDKNKHMDVLLVSLTDVNPFCCTPGLYGRFSHPVSKVYMGGVNLRLSVNCLYD